MTRAAFLARLRSGLRGLDGEDIEELVADYDAHFAEGAADGRSEEEVARALGDPGRLARELRAEAGLRRWESRPSPGSYLGALIALIGVVALDFILILPLLLIVGVVLFAVGVALIAVIFAGFSLFVETVSEEGLTMADFLARALVSVGLISGGIAGDALLLLALEGILKLLASYARLHYRLLNPGEMQPNSTG